MNSRRLLRALLSLMLCLSLSLPAALAVDNVPLGDSESFWIDLPSGWTTMNENLENSSILGHTPGAMYDYRREDGAARAFALHFAGFASPITLDQVSRYLGAEGIVPGKTELNGQPVLEANVSSLGVYGIAFLDQDATGYYIIGVLPCEDGGLENQPAYVQAFFHGIRFGEAREQAAPAVAETVTAAETVRDAAEDVKDAVRDGVTSNRGLTVGKGTAEGFNGPIDVTVYFEGNAVKSVEIDLSTFAETRGVGGKAVEDPAFLNQFMGLTVPVSTTDIDALSSATITSNAIVEAVNNAYDQTQSPSISSLRQQLAVAQNAVAAASAQVIQAEALLADAQNALLTAQEMESQLQELLDAALADLACSGCGYVFPEDSGFRFCPLCGAPR